MAKRVLIAEFMHETNTFSVQLTDEAVFRHHGVFRDNEVPAAFQGTRTSMGAAFEDSYRKEAGLFRGAVAVCVGLGLTAVTATA